MEWCATAAEYEAMDIAPFGNVGHRQLSVGLSCTHAPLFCVGLSLRWYENGIR